MGCLSKEKGAKEAQAKNLIMKAWRERWTAVQWGINVRSLVHSPCTDLSFIANCILSQALSGPGPNSLVLSYLMHSIYSQIISTCAVLKSVSKYDGYHKPYCIASLLDLLDNIKERIILNDGESEEECMELAIALASIVHWLLTCMYSSLEKISDFPISEFPIDSEESKIVAKCKKLIEYFLNDDFLSGLIYCAILEDSDLNKSIESMSVEVAKFSEGHHQQDIAIVTGLVKNVGIRRQCKTSKKVRSLYQPLDGKHFAIASPPVQVILLNGITSKSPSLIAPIVSDFIIIKKLEGMSTFELLSGILHSSITSVLDSFGKRHFYRVLSYFMFVLPELLKSLCESLKVSSDELTSVFSTFIENDSVLTALDAKLSCWTLQLLLDSLTKFDLIHEHDKNTLLQKKPQNTSIMMEPSQGPANTVFNTDNSLYNLLKMFDGDILKNQESILNQMMEIVGKYDDSFITVALCTGRLQQLVSKLLKVNHLTRQAVGETERLSISRATIFDISFLWLCEIFQLYGIEEFPREDTDSFFILWSKDSCPETNYTKNPDYIINRCDQNKVELLLNQYLQSDSELKTSLVMWHETCINAIGVLKDVLLAWDCGSLGYADVTKLIDKFRSKVCCIPVCLAAWLHSYSIIGTQEQSTKAKSIISFLLTPMDSSDSTDNIADRRKIMHRVISRMSAVSNTDICTVSPAESMESKPVAHAFKVCFETMERRGILDIDSVVTIKSLLIISGTDSLVRELINKMMEQHCNSELVQWTKMLFGIFHIDLVNCTRSLLRIIIPSMLHYVNKDSNFVEPQILGLISLTVDCILSCYYRSQWNDETNDEEPSAKKRKLNDSSSGLVDLKLSLQELFEEFDKNLQFRLEARPQTKFILYFLEHLSMKAPDDTLLNFVPKDIISQLLLLLSEEVNTKMILGWHCLSDKQSRLNCAVSICALKNMQNEKAHRFHL